MSAIVGFAGSTSNPSRTRALVHLALGEVARRTGLSTTLFDLNDLGPSVGTARSIGDLSPAARGHLDRLRSARAIIIGSPVYKGSYPGLFKHVFDLLEPDALTGKPVLLAATGGGEKHALVIEHQLRPLFGFFEALTVPTGVYASAADFAGDRPVSSPLVDRLGSAAAQLASAIALTTPRLVADAAA